MAEQPVQPPHTLADLRRTTGLSRRVVAERMGVNEPRVAQIEACYPRLRYDTLSKYIQALGGDIRFIVGTVHAAASQMSPDPASERTRAYLRGKNNKAWEEIARLKKGSAIAEELILQGQAAQPGGDHTGRGVDHGDPESNQGDENDGQQS